MDNEGSGRTTGEMEQIFEARWVAVELDHRRALSPLKSSLTKVEAANFHANLNHTECIKDAFFVHNFITRTCEDNHLPLGKYAESVSDKAMNEFEERCLAIYDNLGVSNPYGKAAVAVVAMSNWPLMVDKDRLPEGWKVALVRQVLLYFRPGGQSQLEFRWGDSILGKCSMQYYPLESLPWGGGEVWPDWRWVLPEEQRFAGHVTYITGVDGTLRFADINTFLAQCAAEELVHGNVRGVARDWLNEMRQFPRTRPAVDQALRRESHEAVMARMLDLEIQIMRSAPDKSRIPQKVVDALLRDLDRGLPSRQGNVRLITGAGPRAADSLLAMPDDPREYLEGMRGMFTAKQFDAATAVLEHGTQKAAADALGISQSAISQRLKPVHNALKQATME